jgi:hypothetical protein
MTSSLSHNLANKMNKNCEYLNETTDDNGWDFYIYLDTDNDIYIYKNNRYNEHCDKKDLPIDYNGGYGGGGYGGGGEDGGDNGNNFKKRLIFYIITSCLFTVYLCRTIYFTCRG